MENAECICFLKTFLTTCQTLVRQIIVKLRVGSKLGNVGSNRISMSLCPVKSVSLRLKKSGLQNALDTKISQC